MFVSKEYLESEKRVAIQDNLAAIVRQSETQKPFTYTVTTHSPFTKKPVKTVYRITAEESK